MTEHSRLTEGWRATPGFVVSEDADEEIEDFLTVLAQGEPAPFETTEIDDSTITMLAAQSTKTASGATKRKSDAAKEAAALKAAKKTAGPVAPSRAVFDTITLGGRKLPGIEGQPVETLRAVFPNAKMLGSLIAKLHELLEDVPLVFTPEGIFTTMSDQGGVILIKIEIPASAFLAYECAYSSRKSLTVATLAFKTNESLFTPTTTMTLAMQLTGAESNKLVLHMVPEDGKHSGFITQLIMPMAIGSHDHEVPHDDSLDYSSIITVSTAKFSSVLKKFIKSSELTFSITETSLDVSNSVDGRDPTMTISIPFLSSAEAVTTTRQPTFGEHELAIYKTVAERECCYRERVRVCTAEEPENMINFHIVTSYLIRTVVMAPPRSHIELAFGRSYANFDGGFSPLRVRFYHLLDGVPVIKTMSLIVPKIDE